MIYEDDKSGRSIGGQKSSEGGRGDPTKASPAAIERYIKGITFPTSKDDLINQAKKNNAPSDVLHVLSQFGDKDFNSPIDISKEVGRIE